jgi:hypothetical protein
MIHEHFCSNRRSVDLENGVASFGFHVLCCQNKPSEIPYSKSETCFVMKRLNNAGSVA